MVGPGPGVPDTEREIAAMLAAFDPVIGQELAQARALLRALFPRGHELVFDNFNALVFAFSATPSPSRAFVSVAGYPRWVNLFFSHGVDLDDPQGLLQGSGRRVRCIRLKGADQLLTPQVQGLLVQAMQTHREALEQAPALSTTIRAVAATRRARRGPPQAE